MEIRSIKSKMYPKKIFGVDSLHCFLVSRYGIVYQHDHHGLRLVNRKYSNLIWQRYMQQNWQNERDQTVGVIFYAFTSGHNVYDHCIYIIVNSST